MQWTADANAGFTSGTPWLPVNSDSANINVASIKAEENSHIKIYEQLSELRETETLLFGKVDMKVDGDVFVLSRVKKGNPGYVFINNFGDTESVVDVSELSHMAERGTLTMIVPKSEAEDGLGVGSSMMTNEITVQPKQALLVTFVPNFS